MECLDLRDRDSRSRRERQVESLGVAQNFGTFLDRNGLAVEDRRDLGVGDMDPRKATRGAHRLDSSRVSQVLEALGGDRGSVRPRATEMVHGGHGPECFG